MLLQVKDLKTYFYIGGKTIRAVDGVNFNLAEGEILGIVGESGCGKSVTALSILRLVSPPGKIVSGEILLRGKNLLKYDSKEMKNIRGKEISMIFQDPKQAFDPVYTIGNHIREALRTHQKIAKKEAHRKAVELLEMVDIPSPEKRIDEYVHQFSGGMAQRAMIAVALACNPSILIADEPTTALDVTIQAGVLELITRLQKNLNLSVILITHNLGIVAQNSQRISIMYAGRIVEEGKTADIFKNPRHPYTSKLLGSVPRLDLDTQQLKEIPGHVPNAATLPQGCKFAPRCELASPECDKEEPQLIDIGNNQKVRCFKRS